jgi:hypothetical protein
MTPHLHAAATIISFFSWERKPQDVDLGVAVELTRNFKARSVIVV